ncbi:MAG: VOC family protein, partial [Patescibacteria group bacterium]|nr:VOC family protein [Patescibacteria group bacterium]
VSEGQIIVISVEAKGEVLEKVEEVRGEIVADPNKVGEMGIYARVKDSEGNVVGVWEDLKGK